MKKEELELANIKTRETDSARVYAFRSNYQGLVLVVSFSKKSQPAMMTWGSSYEWTTTIFKGTEEGHVEDFSPLVTSHDNDPHERMALIYARRYLEELLNDQEID